MMNLKTLGTSLLLAAYGCFVTYVPKNPNLYRLTVDTVGLMFSFTACVIFQVFLAGLTQKNILDGLSIQFLLTVEAALLEYYTLSLMTNINQEGLSTFYAYNLEISKYLLNPKPLACCFCASLVMLSAARLVLIAFPGFYQGISRNTSLIFSVVFVAVIFVSDFLLNHIRCLLTHSKYYASADGDQIISEFGIQTQTFNVTSNSSNEHLECYQIRFAAILLFLSTLMEVIKTIIYVLRLLKKVKCMAPSTKVKSQKEVQQHKPLQPYIAGSSLRHKTFKLKRSWSTGDILSQVVRRPTKRRTSVQQVSTKEIPDQKGVNKLPVKIILKDDSVEFQKMVIKPLKEFFLRSSTISLVMTLVTFFCLINMIINYDRNTSESSIVLMSSVIRIIIFVLPILLIIFDDNVLNFVSQKLSSMFQ